MQARILRTGAAAVAIGSLWLAVSQQPPAQPLTIEKLADDLHIIVGSGGNVAVLTTEDGVILVDDKFDRNVPEILERVRSITNRPVRYILNTHHHGDHTGGNATLSNGAEIVAHDNVYTNMVKGKQPGPPRITFSNRTTVRLGGKEVRMYYYGRGHTNGDAFVLFPQHRVLHTGDMFVAGAPFIDYGNGGSGIDWSDSIDRALQLDFDRVIPGHGPLMAKNDLRGWNEAFGAVRLRMSELKRQGKSSDEATKALKMDDLGLWKAGQGNWRSAGGLYSELR